LQEGVNEAAHDDQEEALRSPLTSTPSSSPSAPYSIAIAAKPASTAAQPAGEGPPEGEQHERGVGGDGPADGDRRERLGGDQSRLAIAGEDESAVERQRAADRGEHREARDQGERVHPGGGQAGVASVDAQRCAGGEQAVVERLVGDERGHQGVPGGHEAGEQHPGEAVGAWLRSANASAVGNWRASGSRGRMVSPGRAAVAQLGEHVEALLFEDQVGDHDDGPAALAQRADELCRAAGRRR